MCESEQWTLYGKIRARLPFEPPLTKRPYIAWKKIGQVDRKTCDKLSPKSFSTLPHCRISSPWLITVVFTKEANSKKYKHNTNADISPVHCQTYKNEGLFFWLLARSSQSGMTGHTVQAKNRNDFRIIVLALSFLFIHFAIRSFTPPL